MENLREIQEKLLNGKHHVYGIETGRAESLASILKEFFADDLVFARYYESLALDKLNEFAPFFYEKKQREKEYILLAFQKMSLELQNALLKKVEELREGKRLIFIYPRSFEILDTLKSRLLVIEDKFSPMEDEFVAEFITAPLSRKFQLINEFLGEEKRKKDPDGDRSISKTGKILDSLEARILEISQKIEKRGEKEKMARFIQSLLDSKSFLDKRGSSAKKILESLAIELSFLKIPFS